MSESWRARARTAIARRTGIDPRALAALRIGVAALLLVDLATRARHLVVFYTDAGVLPRAVLHERYPTIGSLSLHALSGSAPFEAALFALAAAAALALLVGYRTRLAAAASLLLLASLHARNPLVLNAGDALLRRLLLFGLFLPLGARWSVDATRRARERIVRVTPAALLLQVALVYVVNAALKLRGDRWLDGEAIRYVFSLEQFLVGLGPALAARPGLLELLAHGWLAMLVCSPLLVLLTGRARAAFVGLFVVGHLGMAATLRLGIFPLVSVVALLPLLPPPAWDAMAARTPDRLPIPTPRPAGLSRLRPELRPSLSAGASRRARRAARATLVVAVAAMLAWNAAALGVVGTPDALPASADPEERTWDMFAPEPMSTDGWYVVPGTLASGERVDAFHGGDVEWEKPRDVSATYPDWRWRKYLTDLRRSDDPALAHAFAQHLCDRWNGVHDDPLRRVAPHVVTQETRLRGPEPIDRARLVVHRCRP